MKNGCIKYVKQMTMSIIKELNKISENMYGEFGFSTLNEQEMENVLVSYQLLKGFEEESQTKYDQFKII